MVTTKPVSAAALLALATATTHTAPTATRIRRPNIHVIANTSGGANAKSQSVGENGGGASVARTITKPATAATWDAATAR